MGRRVSYTAESLRAALATVKSPARLVTDVSNRQPKPERTLWPRVKAGCEHSGSDGDPDSLPESERAEL